MITGATFILDDLVSDGMIFRFVLKLKTQKGYSHFQINIFTCLYAFNSFVSPTKLKFKAAIAPGPSVAPLGWDSRGNVKDYSRIKSRKRGF